MLGYSLNNYFILPLQIINPGITNLSKLLINFVKLPPMQKRCVDVTVLSDLHLARMAAGQKKLLPT